RAAAGLSLAAVVRRAVIRALANRSRAVVHDDRCPDQREGALVKQPAKQNPDGATDGVLMLGTATRRFPSHEEGTACHSNVLLSARSPNSGPKKGPADKAGPRSGHHVRGRLRGWRGRPSPPRASPNRVCGIGSMVRSVADPFFLGVVVRLHRGARAGGNGLAVPGVVILRGCAPRPPAPRRATPAKGRRKIN